MKKRVDDLQGFELDAWVARALDLQFELGHEGIVLIVNGTRSFRPHDYWLDGGPIIEREGIDLYFERKFSGTSHACVAHIVSSKPSNVAHAKEPLTAAMRCFVKSKFGEEVGE